MKNNLTLAIIIILASIALLVLSIVTKNEVTEKITSLVLGLTTVMMINGLKTIYRHFKQLNKPSNSYEK
jgi:transcription initiation factor TFIIIB Brf1 subunit/transcription initiation factor TFIIB